MLISNMCDEPFESVRRSCDCCWNNIVVTEISWNEDSCSMKSGVNCNVVANVQGVSQFNHPMSCQRVENGPELVDIEAPGLVLELVLDPEIVSGPVGTKADIEGSFGSESHTEVRMVFAGGKSVSGKLSRSHELKTKFLTFYFMLEDKHLETETKSSVAGISESVEVNLVFEVNEYCGNLVEIHQKAYIHISKARCRIGGRLVVYDIKKNEFVLSKVHDQCTPTQNMWLPFWGYGLKNVHLAIKFCSKDGGLSFVGSLNLKISPELKFYTLKFNLENTCCWLGLFGIRKGGMLLVCVGCDSILRCLRTSIISSGLD